MVIPNLRKTLKNFTMLLVQQEAQLLSFSLMLKLNSKLSLKQSTQC